MKYLKMLHFRGYLLFRFCRKSQKMFLFLILFLLSSFVESNKVGTEQLNVQDTPTTEEAIKEICQLEKTPSKILEFFTSINQNVGIKLLMCLRLYNFRNEATFETNFADVGLVGAGLIGPLYRAAYNGDLPCTTTLVEEIQKAGISKDLVNKRTKLGHTPLWVASYMGYIDIVKLLVEKAGANITIPSSTNTHESTPFIISCQQGKIEVLKYFLSKNATLTETKRNDGATCLSMAAANGHLDVVKYITEIRPTLINQRNNAGQSPLWLASYNGKLEVVKYLAEKGAVIEITSNDYDEILSGGSPLIVSCQGGFLDILEYLLSRGADIDSTNTKGSTCLYMASNFGKLDVVKYLLRSLSVDVNKPNNLNRTALFIAAINGHIDVVKELINHSTNTDIEAREEDGMTPLLGSCHSGEIDIVKFLFDKGANLMAKTNDDTNCLILAAGMLNPRKEMENEMLSPYGKGANGDKIRELMNINEGKLKGLMNVGNKDGVTPIYAAAIQGQHEAVEILLKNGALVDQQAIDGTTALMVAAYQTAHTWYPVALVKILVKGGRADVNKDSICCQYDNRKPCCWSPLMAAAYQGQLEVVKFLLENGATHHIKRVKQRLIKLKPDICHATPEEAKLCQAQKAKQSKQWYSVVEFLDCFQLKHDVDKCRDNFMS